MGALKEELVVLSFGGRAVSGRPLALRTGLATGVPFRENERRYARSVQSLRLGHVLCDDAV